MSWNLEKFYEDIRNELNLVSLHLKVSFPEAKSGDALEKMSSQSFLTYLILRKKEKELQHKKKIIKELKKIV